MSNTQLLNKHQIFVVKVQSECVKAIEFPIQCPEGILSMFILIVKPSNSRSVNTLINLCAKKIIGV